MGRKKKNVEAVTTTTATNSVELLKAMGFKESEWIVSERIKISDHDAFRGHSISLFVRGKKDGDMFAILKVNDLGMSMPVSLNHYYGEAGQEVAIDGAEIYSKTSRSTSKVLWVVDMNDTRNEYRSVEVNDEFSGKTREWLKSYIRRHRLNISIEVWMDEDYIADCIRDMIRK